MHVCVRMCVCVTRKREVIQWRQGDNRLEGLRVKRLLVPVTERVSDTDQVITRYLHHILPLLRWIREMFCSPFGKKFVFDMDTAEALSISGSGRWSKTKRLFFPRKRKSYLQSTCFTVFTGRTFTHSVTVKSVHCIFIYISQWTLFLPPLSFLMYPCPGLTRLCQAMCSEELLISPPTSPPPSCLFATWAGDHTDTHYHTLTFCTKKINISTPHIKSVPLFVMSGSWDSYKHVGHYIWQMLKGNGKLWCFFPCY